MLLKPTKLTLPRITQAVLRDFSLFPLQPEISVEFPEGVFCLAGANGLGKSTFLSSLNYAVTGLIPEPGRKFESVAEYYTDSGKFAADYFSGRVNETDRDAAEITVKMQVGNFEYHITRGLFEVRQLRELVIHDIADDHSFYRDDSSVITPRERHDIYTQSITKHVGLASFEQFVFLQLFVFTFDERRHLLFWDQKVLQQALYLAFGVDYQDAKKADVLGREKEKAGSLARNAQWQASDIRRKIQQLEAAAKATAADPNEDLEGQHQYMSGEVEKNQSLLVAYESELKDVNLRLSELSAQQAALRGEYSAEFSSRYQSQPTILLHPLITSSLAENKCGLCGSRGQGVVTTINTRIRESNCPLCESPLHPSKPNSDSVVRLQQLDEAITANKTELNELLLKVERLSIEVSEAHNRLNTSREQLEAFNQANALTLTQLYTAKTSGTDLLRVLDSYRAQMNEFVRKKDLYYARRDEKQKELRKLQETLEDNYFAAEDVFVPAFKDLATHFLGLDLAVRMETRSQEGVNLILEVNSSFRRQQHQLSESQKFFVDIALRMALAQYMSNQQDRACLFIDTPEGSLDIAYESRAGDMFALFVDGGYDMVMTANINSSQLLRRLAEKCGRTKLYLCRMTSWTELSDVQKEEEILFEQAYTQIEQALDRR